MAIPNKMRAKDGKAVRVAAYARVSTLNQVLENDSSVDTQLVRIRRRAEYESEQAVHREDADPWRIVEEYREEGRSAKNTDRPALQRLLSDVRLGKVDMVVATKIDRITRSLTDFYDLWRTFEEYGVEFVALDDNFETRSAAGRAMLKITLIFAELERERTSERTREKVMARRSGGLWFGGTVPIGYRPHASDKTTLVKDEKWAQIVRDEIFEGYLTAGSARALVRRLANQGITRPTRKTRRGGNAGGGPFTVQGVLNILSSSTYVGERELDDGAVVKAAWPAIIDKPLFQRVKAKLDLSSVDRPSGKSTTGHVYLLDGRLRCGSCGAAMTRATGTGTMGRVYFYYRCGNKTRTAGTRCSVRDVPAEAVESFVIDQVKNYAIDPTAIGKAVRLANAGRDRELASLEVELKKGKSALLAAAKAATAMVDAVEKDVVEGGGQAGPGLRARLREREATAQALRVEVEDMQFRRDALRQKLLDDEVVAEGYERLPALLDLARERGAHELLRGLLQAVIDVVEWREDEADPRRGTATIMFYELPEGFWEAIEAQKEERPNEPLSNGSSLSRPVWLPSEDLNLGPGD